MLFELGLGPIPWMIVTEMYDTDHVSAAQATASQLNWVCNILVGLGFPLLDAGLGPLAFAPFGAVLAAGLAFVVLGLPETLNSTPTELHDQLLRECGAAAPRGGKYGTLQHAASGRA